MVGSDRRNKLACAVVTSLMASLGIVFAVVAIVSAFTVKVHLKEHQELVVNMDSERNPKAPVWFLPYYKSLTGNLRQVSLIFGEYNPPGSLLHLTGNQSFPVLTNGEGGVKIAASLFGKVTDKTYQNLISCYLFELIYRAAYLPSGWVFGWSILQKQLTQMWSHWFGKWGSGSSLESCMN